jgi:hypothetical protein
MRKPSGVAPGRLFSEIKEAAALLIFKSPRWVETDLYCGG